MKQETTALWTDRSSPLIGGNNSHARRSTGGFIAGLVATRPAGLTLNHRSPQIFFHSRGLTFHLKSCSKRCILGAYWLSRSLSVAAIIQRLIPLLRKPPLEDRSRRRGRVSRPLSRCFDSPTYHAFSHCDRPAAFKQKYGFHLRRTLRISA